MCKFFGAWWIDGWIVSLSNELQDPSIEPALERMYIRHFDYSEPNPNYVLWMMVAKTFFLTIVANISGNSSSEYGKNATLKPVAKNGMSKMLDPNQPEAREEAQKESSFGEGVLPSVMSMASRFMPQILGSLAGGGGLGSLVGGIASMFGNKGPAPVRVQQPNMGPGLAPFVQPSF